MTFFGGPAQGVPRTATLGASASRQDILGRKYQGFSNPFFDQASTYMPANIKSLFGFCRNYHLTHGIINAINTKAAEYPITDLLLSHQDKGVVERWKYLMHGSLNYRVFQLEANLDYFVLGNSFISPSLPFTKMLTCKMCGAEQAATKCRAQWRYNNHGFWLSCSKCGQSDWAKARDDYYPRVTEISLMRWNPENINIFYNETTGRADYTLDFGNEFKNHIIMGRKDLVATTPQAILEAIKTQRTLVFDSSSVFHMRRPGLSGMGKWGIPLMLPVLKDAFYMQIMKKANECTLLTQLSPQTFLFPQPATSGADPFTVASLSDWRDHIRRELARQRMDPAYIGILPFPLGHQTIGENGKSLLLMPEIQNAAESICVGMGFPPDLIFGNGTYAGSSVNMRMLENFFMSNVHTQMRLVQWVMRHFSSFLGWPVPDARFKAFRMADDVQRQAMMLQMNAQDLISDTTLLSQADLKVEDETKLRMSEMAIKAEAMRKKADLIADIQGSTAVITAKYNARAQAAAQSAAVLEAQAHRSPFADSMGTGLARNPGLALDAAAAALATALTRMPPERRAAYMTQLRDQIPEMAQLMTEQDAAGMPQPPPDGQGQQEAPQGDGMVPTGTQQPGVDMRGLPEKLPPRRPGAA